MSLNDYIAFSLLFHRYFFVIKVLTLNKTHSMLPNNKLVYQQAISIHLKVKDKGRRGKSGICKEWTEKDRTGDG